MHLSLLDLAAEAIEAFRDPEATTEYLLSWEGQPPAPMARIVRRVPNRHRRHAHTLKLYRL